MEALFPTFRDLLSLLIKHQIDFILIGGYAVIYHGYERTTNDLDIWLAPDNDARDRLIVALQEFGIEERAIAELREKNFEEAQFFYIGKEPQKVEFLTKISNVNFADAYRKKVIAEVDGLQVPFLELKDLVLAKMNTGRLQDKADVEELQKIQKARKDI